MLFNADLRPPLRENVGVWFMPRKKEKPKRMHTMDLASLDVDTRKLVAFAMKMNGVGLSQTDTAAVMGKSRAYVQEHEANAIRKIRRIMEREIL